VLRNPDRVAFVAASFTGYFEFGKMPG